MWHTAAAILNFALLTHGRAIDKASLGLSGALLRSDRTATIKQDQVIEGCSNGLHDAKDPKMVHVVYSADQHQIEGLKASMASLILASSNPALLTIHLLLRPELLSYMQDVLKIPRHCNSIINDKTGTLIRLHQLDLHRIEKTVTHVPSKAKRNPENYARFFMDTVIDPNLVVIYLDADTIVRTDLGFMKDQLISSGKTVAFVDRATTVSDYKFSYFMISPDHCNADLGTPWEELSKKTVYNVGVLAVDLKRWKEAKALDRVQKVIDLHNNCPGDGFLRNTGSQLPLVAAFVSHPQDEQDDYIVVKSAFNVDGFGKHDVREIAPTLRFDHLLDPTGTILHWTGPGKPWLPNGFNQKLWKPYREQFSSVFQEELSQHVAMPQGNAREESQAYSVEITSDGDVKG
eukprot:TRINITY_DN5116_c8_g1_i1.p1 TRINITY_DN5116_c8_g1~~TRINITY_DN5116_c8_g1_i1.p1  ORF type:complete len:403 (+),score=57.43 TRINITY_DN5116_c8_g1_i1:154-1362(+)